MTHSISRDELRLRRNDSGTKYGDGRVGDRERPDAGYGHPVKYFGDTPERLWRDAPRYGRDDSLVPHDY